MWIYHKEAEHIEVITNIETGAQVTRSSNEIWWVHSVIAKGRGSRYGNTNH